MSKRFKLNPWLISWRASGERSERTIRNHIAAILPNKTSERDVERTMLLLYANYCACPGLSDELYLWEQIRFARRDYPYKVVQHPFDQMVCGGNPFLEARMVFNLTFSSDEEGNEKLTWEENIYPALKPGVDPVEHIDAARPFKRQQMTYSTQTRKIERL
jgi:hypothetical protein